MHNLSGVDLAILQAVEGKPCRGLVHLTEIIGLGDSGRWYVRQRVKRLQRQRLLIVHNPRPRRGRGNKVVIERADKDEC